MKNSFVIFLIFVSAQLAAQDEDTDQKALKNELSIRIENIFTKPPLLYSYGPWPFSYYPSNFPLDYPPVQVGLDYKLHFPKSAIRTGVVFVSRKEQKKYERNQQEDINYKVSYGFSLGYELHKTIDKFQLFYGIDFFYTYFKDETEIEYVNDGELIRTENLTINSLYGLTPLLGLRYYIMPSFSLSTELGYDMGLYNGKYEQKQNNNPDNNNGWKEEGNFTRLGPLGMISINYHF